MGLKLVLFKRRPVVGQRGGPVPTTRVVVLVATVAPVALLLVALLLVAPAVLSL